MNKPQPASILIIDSDSESLFAIADFLLANAYRVLTSRDAKHGLMLARNEELDLLLVNSRLGVSSGIEFVHQVSRLRKLSRKPVIFLSSNQIPGIIRRRHSFGDAYHLRKPVHPAVLLELMKTLLKQPAGSEEKPKKSIGVPHFTFSSQRSSAFSPSATGSSW